MVSSVISQLPPIVQPAASNIAPGAITALSSIAEASTAPEIAISVQLPEKQPANVPAKAPEEVRAGKKVDPKARKPRVKFGISVCQKNAASPEAAAGDEALPEEDGKAKGRTPKRSLGAVAAQNGAVQAVEEAAPAASKRARLGYNAELVNIAQGGGAEAPQAPQAPQAQGVPPGCLHAVIPV